jgi:predicted O-linked N-acetylglucosamine transferase (SPINDLY family)
VFCCFNSSYKITSEVFDIWMRLLGKVAGSVMWLLDGSPGATRNLRVEAHERGVVPERLVFAPRMALEEHLARHRLADLMLDTLPVNAHTTASDALWAGLPVLTCSGRTFAGRVAGSLLNAAGLPELITESHEEYEALALRLAATPALLSAVREKLLRNRASYPLFDTDRFRRHLESAYSTMWGRYQQREPPVSFSVQPIR